MGNKLYVDSKVSQIDDIIKFPIENLKFNDTLQEDKEKFLFENLKVWRYYEDDEEKIKSEVILMTSIREKQFLLSSNEAYIILLL